MAEVSTGNLKDPTVKDRHVLIDRLRIYCGQIEAPYSWGHSLVVVTGKVRVLGPGHGGDWRRA